MKFPVKLVLEIRTQEEYDTMQETIQSIKTHAVLASHNSEQFCQGPEGTVDSKSIELLENATVRLIDSSKESRVLINGYPIVRGTIEDMSKRYETECAMHLKSNIVLEEWIDGEYKSLRSRRLQKL